MLVGKAQLPPQANESLLLFYSERVDAWEFAMLYGGVGSDSNEIMKKNSNPCVHTTYVLLAICIEHEVKSPELPLCQNSRARPSPYLHGLFRVVSNAYHTNVIQELL